MVEVDEQTSQVVGSRMKSLIVKYLPHKIRYRGGCEAAVVVNNIPHESIVNLELSRTMLKKTP